jgi:hypothetical protein
MINKDRVLIVLAINTLISRLGFFEISNMTINFANKKFISE